MVALVASALGCFLAVRRMEVDIFPSLNLPVIYVCQPYGGMDPAQMEGFLTNYYEYHFLYISGIHHVESRNVQGMALMKLYFHPGTEHGPGDGRDDQLRQPLAGLHAAGHGVAVRHAVRHRQRAGRLPGAVQRDAQHRRDPGPGPVPRAADVRQPAGRLGAAAVRRQPADRRRHGRSGAAAGLRHVARRSRHGADAGQRDQPVGQRAASATSTRSCRSTRWCAMSTSWRRSRSAPAPSAPVYLRDVGYVQDATDAPTGYALVNGRRAVYILVTKRADASTLSVVNSVKAALPEMQAVLPPDINVSFEFDQSPYVTRAIWGVVTEGAAGRGARRA